MTQLDLFSWNAPPARGGSIVQLTHDPLPAFAANSDTSRQAAIEKHKRGNSTSQRERIYAEIARAGTDGLTREQIQNITGLSGDTVRPRVKELLGEAKGWTVPRIKVADKPGKTKSGMAAEVLIIINMGPNI